MQSSSYSSRSSTPTPQRRHTIVFDIKNREFQLVCASLILSLINVIVPPCILLTSLKSHDSIYSFQNAVMCLCCILYNLLSSPFFEDSHSTFTENLSNFILSRSFNYIVFVFGCYYTGLVLYPFYIALFARSLKGVFIALDRLYSGKSGEFTKLIQSFTKPGCNNAMLTRAAALFEILHIPYLLFALIFVFNRHVLFGLVLVLDYIYESYKKDQDHQQILTQIYQFIESLLSKKN